MEIESNKIREQETKKMLPITILWGILLMIIPIGAALLISKPELRDVLKGSFGEIIKGVGIGLSILPVSLLVAIKGKETWYKKIWCLALLAVTMISILFIVLFL